MPTRSAIKITCLYRPLQGLSGWNGLGCAQFDSQSWRYKGRYGKAFLRQGRFLETCRQTHTPVAILSGQGQLDGYGNGIVVRQFWNRIQKYLPTGPPHNEMQRQIQWLTCGAAINGRHMDRLAGTINAPVQPQEWTDRFQCRASGNAAPGQIQRRVFEIEQGKFIIRPINVQGSRALPTTALENGFGEKGNAIGVGLDGLEDIIVLGNEFYADATPGAGIRIMADLHI